MANALNWFEIPATNHDRAVKFYKTVLKNELQSVEMDGIKMSIFTYNDGEISGSICTGDGYKPSANGALIYLNGGEDLSDPLSRVETAGGKIVLPKTKISDEIGYMAYFMDTEGNKMAFHSPK